MNRLKEKRRGAGGIFFLVCCSIGVFIMLTITDISRTSTVKAVSDNIAHVIATKVAIHSYNSGLGSFTVTNSGSIRGDTNYSPLGDFNRMINEYGIASVSSREAKVVWNNSTKVATVDIGPFESAYGSTITPYRQATTIEDR